MRIEVNKSTPHKGTVWWQERRAHGRGRRKGKEWCFGLAALATGLPYSLQNSVAQALCILLCLKGVQAAGQGAGRAQSEVRNQRAPRQGSVGG